VTFQVSGVTPACFTTCCHFAYSLRITVAKASGVVGAIAVQLRRLLVRKGEVSGVRRDRARATGLMHNAGAVTAHALRGATLLRVLAWVKMTLTQS
jgi:hypothetical protein